MDKTEQQQTWWQKIKQHPYIAMKIIAICIIVLILIAIDIQANGTGFSRYDKVSTATEATVTPLGKGPAQKVTTTIEPQPGKTLWDWMQLLIAPAVISLFGLWFTRMQQQRDRKRDEQQHAQEYEIAKKRIEDEQKIATDNQREAALQAYIDKMSELLLDIKRPLRESKSEDEVRKIARVRTLTVLPRLGTTRKGSALQFLYESGLIDKATRIVDLTGADLNAAELSRAHLRGANLSRISLREADLREANLREADLQEADLSGAKLNNADLSYAFLKGTVVTQEQLKQAKSLKGAIMLDGSEHS